MGKQTITSRRQVLSAVAIGVTAALAGCSDGSTDDTGSSGESENGPEAVLADFFTAIDSGNIDEANSYYIEEAGSDDRPVEQRSVVVHSIEDHSIEQAADNAPGMMDGGDVSAAEVEEFGTQLAEQFNHSESEWTVVYFDVEIDGVSEENYSWVVQTESGWKIGFLAMFGA